MFWFIVWRGTVWLCGLPTAALRGGAAENRSCCGTSKQKGVWE